MGGIRRVLPVGAKYLHTPWPLPAPESSGTQKTQGLRVSRCALLGRLWACDGCFSGYAFGARLGLGVVPYDHYTKGEKGKECEVAGHEYYPLESVTVFQKKPGGVFVKPFDLSLTDFTVSRWASVRSK